MAASARFANTQRKRAKGPSSKTPTVGVSLGAYLQAAAAAHQAGRMDEAKEAYQTILRQNPDNTDALQLLGVLLHQGGDSEKGQDYLQRAIALQPKDPRIRNNFGSVLRDLGRLQEAEVEFATAVALAPDPETCVNHGIVLEQLQRYDEARYVYAMCLSGMPDHKRALRGVGSVLLRLSHYEEAESHLRRLNALQPQDPETLGNLAIAVQAQGRSGEAEELFQAAIKQAAGKPALRSSLLSLLNSEPRDESAREAFRQLLREDPKAWPMEIGVAHRLMEIGRLEHAQQILDDILAVHDTDPAVWNDTGGVLLKHGKYKESIAYFHRAIELEPRLANAYCNLGSAYMATHQWSLAVKTFREALTRNPAAFQAQISMVRTLRLMGRFEEANIFARSALDLLTTAAHIVRSTPEGQVLLLQFLKTICNFDGLDQLGDVWAIGDTVPPTALPAMFLDYLVFGETQEDVQSFIRIVRRWAAYVEACAAQTPLPPLVARASKTRLRVGILSSDLRSHSVARFITPFFEGYDRDKVELFCYSPLRHDTDAIQKKLSGLADSFKYVDEMTDRQVAETIRADDVDILLELNGFTQFTRLAALAYKPAPVQMSWLGYPFTSGLKSIDYVVMDRFVAPQDEATLVEQALIMPEAWVCFGKFSDTPIDPVLPMERNGFITFGTLNNPYKYNRSNIALWARVMREVPNSRFLMVRPESSSVTLVKNIATEFAKHGISSDRIYVRDNRREERDHMSYYNEIDISLDTFPLTGGTTTCEATWMGVPVVTLVGEAFHQRISYSVLMQCGLDELCTFTQDDFVERAVRLTGEREKLAMWRTEFRQIMQASPLCDEPRFLHQFQEMLEQVAKLHGLR